MELNRTNKKTKVVSNPEGVKQYKRRPEIQLYLEASNLNVRFDSFYKSAKDKLQSVIDLSDVVDKKYLAGLSRYLADNGLKLSPVVLSSRLSYRGYDFEKDGRDFTMIYPTPKFIANAISLNNDFFKVKSSFKKSVLKKALENMKPVTLLKNKLSTRKIKLKNLINMLHPRPKNEEMSKLYKDILEGKATLDSKKSITNTLSSNNLSKDEKKKNISENIDTLPINQIIRNLRFLDSEYDFLENTGLQLKINKRFRSIIEKNAFRTLNIFDLITAAIEVPVFQKALHDIVEKFVKEKVGSAESGNILIDTSGSMHGQGEEITFKYLVIYAILFKKLNVRFFSEIYYKHKNTPELLELIRKGKYKEAKMLFKGCFSYNWTALSKSARLFLNEFKSDDNFIIISDEVGNYDSFESLLPAETKDKTIIVTNPVVYTGTAIKGNIARISSLTSNILTDLALLFDQDSFINYVRNY